MRRAKARTVKITPAEYRAVRDDGDDETMLLTLDKRGGVAPILATRSGLSLARTRAALARLKAKGLAEWHAEWISRHGYRRRWKSLGDKHPGDSTSQTTD